MASQGPPHGVNLDTIAKPLGLLNSERWEWGTTVRPHLKLNKQINPAPAPSFRSQNGGIPLTSLSDCFHFALRWGSSTWNRFDLFLLPFYP